MTISKLKVLPQPQIGQLICKLRQELGLTQEEFAASLGVVFSTINRWEKGRAQPSPMALKQLEAKLREMGKRGDKLLQQHLAESGR